MYNALLDLLPLHVLAPVFVVECNAPRQRDRLCQAAAAEEAVASQVMRAAAQSAKHGAHAGPRRPRRAGGRYRHNASVRVRVQQRKKGATATGVELILVELSGVTFQKRLTIFHLISTIKF